MSVRVRIHHSPSTLSPHFPTPHGQETQRVGRGGAGQGGLLMTHMHDLLHRCSFGVGVDCFDGGELWKVPP